MMEQQNKLTTSSLSSDELRQKFDLSTLKLKGVRTREARQSPLHFGLIYLPHYLTETIPSFHLEIQEILLRPREYYVAIAAPRDHAKSTFVDVVHTLWELYYGLFHFTIFIGDTAEQAKQNLASVIYEIENNELLAHDFGAMKPPKEQMMKWTDSTIITANNRRLEAIGVGSKIRGRKHLKWRPDRLKFDDIENDENVNTKEQRDKLSHWFFSAALNAMDKIDGRAVIIGTILHHDSLLSNLLDEKKNPNWCSKKYTAVNYDNAGNPHALWPERYSLADLAVKKAVLQSVIFEQEFNNNPTDEGSRMVKRAWIKYHSGIRPEDAKNMMKVMRVDPATSDKEKNDKFAIAVLGIDDNNKIYQLDAFNEHLDTPQHVDTIYVYAAKWGLDKPENLVIHIESNAYQVSLQKDMARKSQETKQYWVVVPIHTDKDKTLRVKGQSGIIEAGYVLFDPNTSADLVDQLCNFGKTRYDDLADAFVGGLEGIRVLTPAFLDYMKQEAEKARQNPVNSFIRQYGDLINQQNTL